MSTPEVLPDSRARTIHTARRQVFTSNGAWIPVFCANCGKEGGLCHEASTHAFWLCNPCFERMGHITGTMVVPDAEYYAKVAQEMHAANDGKDMTPLQLAKVREDNDTPLARLLLEAK